MRRRFPESSKLSSAGKNHCSLVEFSILFIEGVLLSEYQEPDFGLVLFANFFSQILHPFFQWYTFLKR